MAQNNITFRGCKQRLRSTELNQNVHPKSDVVKTKRQRRDTLSSDKSNTLNSSTDYTDESVSHPISNDENVASNDHSSHNSPADYSTRSGDINDVQQELSRHYSGQLDSNDEPHGRGTLTITYSASAPDSFSTEQTVFEGHFRHGKKISYGKLTLPDGSVLQGKWFNDDLNGFGWYYSPDSGTIRGEYLNGELCGLVSEYDLSGRLVYEGNYEDNMRNGFGTLYVPDDKTLFRGTFSNGELHGHNVEFVYPLERYKLIGEWHNGEMVKANFYKDDQCVDQTLYEYDPPTQSCISKEPLKADPYESQIVYVAPSTIKCASDSYSANEGLFAKLDLPPFTIISFYSGIKQSDHVTESRQWIDNANVMTLSEIDGIDIDVPSPFDQLKRYNASLGHKCNHTFDKDEQNARYSHFFHPRFGHIKCIETIKTVKENDEIFVDYGYDLKDCPQWYEIECKAHKASKNS